MTAAGIRDQILGLVSDALASPRVDRSDPVDVAAGIVDLVELRELEIREEVAQTIENRAIVLRGIRPNKIGPDDGPADHTRTAFCDGLALGATLARGGDRV